MIKIWIYRKYKLGRWTIQLPIIRLLPKDWKQTKLKHLKAISAALISTKHKFGEPMTDDTKIRSLRNLLSIRPEEFYTLSDLQVCTLLNAINDLFETAPSYSKSIIGRLKLPKSLLVGDSTEAFAMYETYYEKILTTEDEKDRLHALSLLCGYLLRPVGQSVDDTRARKLAKKLQADIKASYTTLFFTYWWYFCTRQELVKRYGSAFGKGSTRKGPDYTSVHGWWGLIHSVAQDGPFGNEEEVRATEVHFFLDWLEYSSNRHKEQQWHMKHSK